MKPKAVISCVMALCTAFCYAQKNTQPEKNDRWTEKTARIILSDITAEAQQLRQNSRLIMKQKTEAVAQADALEQRLRTTTQELRQEADKLRQAMNRKENLERVREKDRLCEQTIRTMAGNDLEFCLQEQLQLTADTVTGTMTETRATAPDGTIIPGRQLTIGPFAYFQENTENPRCAILANQPNQPYPRLFLELTHQQQQEIARLFKGEMATPPLDPSGGKALAVIQHADTWDQHLRKGGIIMAPLAILAAVAALTILWKACQFLRLERRLTDLKRLARENPRLDEDTLEEKLYLATCTQNASLERFLATIAVCASAAPLLGLLGTVTGMIHTFSLITIYGTGDPRLLSTGISEALITTEAGLTIAIPALLAHAWLSRKLKRFQARQKQTAIDLIAGRKKP